MSIKQRLRHGLEHSNGFVKRIMDEITDADDWVRCPTPGSNHALWIIGHLGYATNYFIGLIDESRGVAREDFGSLFGKGSTPVEELSHYPAIDDVRDYWTDRSTALLDLLEETSEDDLQRELPAGPGFMPDVGSVFQMAVWHDSTHAGQLTVVHRLIGQTPIADR